MNTAKQLVIYDNTGKLYYLASGDYTVPAGLPYLEVEVPADEFIVSVDPKAKKAVTAKMPQSPEQKNADDITNLQLALAELAEGGLK